MRLAGTLLKTIGIAAFLFAYLVFTYGVLPRNWIGLALLFVIGLPIALAAELLIEKAGNGKNSVVRWVCGILGVGIIVAFIACATMYRGEYDKYF
jgi:hypothetical protein